MSTINITIDIINKKGLHARAAAKFVKVVTSYTAQVTAKKLGQAEEEETPSVVGSSILGLLMLGADPGSKLYITAEGDQAEEVINALKELIDNCFGEPQ